MRLSELKPGEEGIVVKILGHGAFRKRVMEMGFVRGHVVRALLEAPLGDPVKYALMNYEVSLRRSEASLIEVIPVTDDTDTHATPDAHLRLRADVVDRLVEEHRHTINVALIGNPNCGKTSLFNLASGAREHVGNYSGVTVDAKTGVFHHRGYTFNIVDLPGTYSLATYSPEEMYVRRYLRDYTPDVIINVVDASNLERNLFLTTELIDMDRRMVIALNMYDELRNQGAEFQYRQMADMIGVPMVPVVAKTGEGIDKLFDTVVSVFEDANPTVRHIHVLLGQDIESAVRRIVDLLKADPRLSRHFSPRYLAIKLLEGDREVEDQLRSLTDNPTGDQDTYRKIMLVRDELRGQIEQLHQEDISATVAAEKYGFIAGALAETYRPGKSTRSTTRLLDRLATNAYLGFPIFFLIMLFIFWATFVLGQYPMEGMEWLVDGLAQLVGNTMSPGPLKDLVQDGIIGGVGGVIVFLPNILILFFCISFMEDTGYMARAAFIMDRVMHRIGLHGKSFIPMIMGFGCNVPAILASRSIESRSSRIITVLINPFMSCSARLPIYVLMIGTFFSAYAAWVFMGIYVLGIAVAVVTARLLRKFFFKKDETPFVMELPPYRLPTLRASLTHTWEKGKEYLRKMGGIILLSSIVVWALNYFPVHRHDDTSAIQTSETVEASPAPDTDSYLCRIGKFVTPVLEPIGFDWRSTVAALAGVPAKEIVVSTLGVLYTNDEEVADSRLGHRMVAEGYTPAAALAFMIFILLYCPCLATVVAIARETGRRRYAVFSVLYNTAVAWLVAFAAYRLML